MLDYVYLQMFDFLPQQYFHKSSLRAIVSGTNKTDAIIYIERSYANCILQLLMDRIIDIFGKRKNRKSFMRFAHVLIICYILG